MARIEEVTHIEAPPEHVWAVVTAWERQAEWMQDARSVVVRSAHRSGVGVELRCRTNILGVVLTDDVVVTDWRPPEAVVIRHTRWPLRGVAAFELEPTSAGTRFTWWTEAVVPFGEPGDAVAGAVIVPVTRRIFRASLARLKQLCEAPA